MAPSVPSTATTLLSFLSCAALYFNWVDDETLMANRSLDGGYINAAQAEKGSFLKDTNAPWQKLEKGQKFINICYLASFLHFMGKLKLPKMPIKKVHHSPQLLLFLTSFLVTAGVAK